LYGKSHTAYLESTPRLLTSDEELNQANPYPGFAIFQTCIDYPFASASCTSLRSADLNDKLGEVAEKQCREALDYNAQDLVICVSSVLIGKHLVP
jgi:hypothetical protein